MPDHIFLLTSIGLHFINSVFSAGAEMKKREMKTGGSRFLNLTFSLILQKKLQILLSTGDAEGASGIAMAAVRHYSQSAAMWSLCLRTLMQLGSGDVGKLFQEALAHVHPKVHTHTHTDTL